MSRDASHVPGTFVVSLDFELFWGLHDHSSLAECERWMAPTRQVVGRLLERFEAHAVHATWATVGMLFHESAADARRQRPVRLPSYEDPRFSPYENGAMERLGAGERDDPLRLARSLIERVAATPGQELGSHTYSHYYCLEAGQTVGQFEADLEAAAAAAAALGLTLRSLVLPRNQYATEHLDAATRCGFDAVRTQPDHPLYRSRDRAREGWTLRAARALDACLPLSGDRTFERPRADVTGRPVRVPASAFLRPWRARSRALTACRVERIEREMTRAADTGRCYHLWWHPHNFARRPEENFEMLEKILSHRERLHDDRGLRSLNMGELAAEALRDAS